VFSTGLAPAAQVGFVGLPPAVMIVSGTSGAPLSCLARWARRADPDLKPAAVGGFDGRSGRRGAAGAWV
jgi:hypothetical protein